MTNCGPLFRSVYIKMIYIYHNITFILILHRPSFVIVTKPWLGNPEKCHKSKTKMNSVHINLLLSVFLSCSAAGTVTYLGFSLPEKCFFQRLRLYRGAKNVFNVIGLLGGLMELQAFGETRQRFQI